MIKQADAIHIVQELLRKGSSKIDYKLFQTSLSIYEYFNSIFI